MKFRSEIQIPRSEITIEHGSKVLMIGSCFSQNIGNKLNAVKIVSKEISHGILFNPHSVNQALTDIIGNVRYSLDEINSEEGLHFSFNHHGFKSTDKYQVLDHVNQGIAEDFELIQDVDIIFITLGSAWVYKHKDFGFVANCHKVPNHQFEKVKMGVNEIVSELSRTFEHLFSLNPQVKVIFTVSPVRHWKDGAVENQWRKSTLNVAAHELVRRFDGVSYFPAYELVMDDLRDYRFFKEDLMHPNEMAINYVWEKFQKVYLSGHARDGVDLIEKWFKGFDHKVLGGEGDLTRHITGLLERADELEMDFEIDLSTEKAQLSMKLNKLVQA
ncbi:MAG: GSCFA domain-containing protein [Flavobacteriales bacterium]|nr:GSCFA domain-containing protein [Flavobacteriales bacterium]